ncbi:hypothetical protein [Streptomyces sp. B15]|uniref:hypothetical protein n=1 Tax=Streptomyces sp. B15 TaxID=1537797 RepID=UPI001B3905BE|nr:hypothetical protein [Streptomyces sp. B15]MBQ1122996.1 hypothetical protein [Streptomyces sp. B15]
MSEARAGGFTLNDHQWNRLAQLGGNVAALHRQMTKDDSLENVPSLGTLHRVARLLSSSGLALGALLGGWLASALGLQPPFLVAGTLFAAATVISLLALPHFRARE